MKILFSGLFILVTTILHAGQDKTPLPLGYCLMTVTENPADGKVVVKMDFGTDTAFTNTWKHKGFDDKGRPKKFDSPLDVLNWMGAEGWDFVNVFSSPADSGRTSHYLMRKKTRLLFLQSSK